MSAAATVAPAFGAEGMMGESEGDEQSQRRQGPLGATVECGPYRREAEIGGLDERSVTLGTFLAFTTLVDDPETDPDELGEFLSVTIEETGQLWIYPTDVFLQNLLHRRGDQAKVSRALARLAPQGSEDESEGT